jgi:hypothetical protein
VALHTSLVTIDHNNSVVLGALLATFIVESGFANDFTVEIGFAVTGLAAGSSANDE